ncbi:Panacea domain-containing protein [Aurantimonas sp. A3-2-R12]|uniref:Panacea domain-containing protein n=1 Tax=Aurantimonas sp. A3-2-R12 TaxID=3114362 RepID=UPI002E17B434|nr:Panacea domain-containing protein [Aurantimonas sp. A3-2-R12]
MADRAYDREKLKALVHYVIWKAGSRPNFGATKLYKIAWFSDARCFVLKGRSITGAPYIRQEHGPIPRDGIIVRNELARAGLISQKKLPSFRGEAWSFRSMAPPDPNVFEGYERAEIDWWIKHIDEDHTATSISDESHDYGWEIAQTGEKLPFVSILAQRVREPNQEELAWARTRARELSLP